MRAASASPQQRDQGDAAARTRNGDARDRITGTVRTMLARVPEAGRAANRLAVETFGGTAEPSLLEVFGDPVVRVLMARDGVHAAALRGVIRDAQARL